MATCPNKAHPDWKTLETRHGEKGAWKMYIENGYNIPVPELPSSKVKFDADGVRYNSRDTMQALDSNPKMAKEIIDSLAELYPNVKIYENGLFDKDGNWLDIPPGEKGMHYRNAFEGAVAWSNDARMETPPHEYAHEYVDMFREMPIVKKGIEKYGEEQLVKRMGAYYAGRKMSSSFSNFVQDFWESIRSFFGNPDVADILSQNFYKGKMLSGKPHQGTAIVRYHEGDGVLKESNGGVNSEGQYSEADVTVAENIDEESANKAFKRVAIDNDALVYDESDIAKSGEANNFNVNKLRTVINERIQKLRGRDRTRDGREMNSPNTDSRILEDVQELIKDDELIDKVANYILGKREMTDEKLSLDKTKVIMPAKEIPLSAQEQLVYNTIISIEQRLDYLSKTENSFYDSNGNLVNAKPVIENISNEISEAAKRRVAMYDKIPNKALKKFFKGFEKLLAQWQLNARLITKYLSGSENSELSDMVYKALDQADGKKLGIMQRFTDIFTGVDSIPGYKKWGVYNNQGAEIDALDTVDVNTDQGTLKLTKAELLSLYLNLRQGDSRTAIANKGFILDQDIKGRDIEFGNTFKIAPSEEIKINSIVEKDSQMMEVVSKIDESLDYMYSATNPTFRQEQGYDLPKLKNYFPVYTGEKSITLRRSKNSLDEWRAGNARLGQDKPLRIGDAVGVMSNVKNSGATYAAYALPIANIRKLQASLAKKYMNKQEEVYFKSIDGIIENIESPGELFNSWAESNFSQKVNMITSNFAVSVLGMNLAVMMKQPVSYITAMEEIDKKYLKEAGWGIGGFVGISPQKIFKSLAYTGVEGGDTLIPVEWRLDKKDNPIYDEMMQDPKMRARLEGMVSKETGEALMNAEIGQDKIPMPWKNKQGEKVYISKARLMEGIKIFDSVTIMSIWKAVKLETAEQLPQLVEGTAEYKQHVAIRVNNIVNKTQPTYDAANRAALSLSKNPVARVFTMFSSARSKVAMLLIDGAVSYINNPSPENKKKLFKRLMNVGVTTALTLTLIDMLKGGVLYGFDDDDDIAKAVSMNMITTNLGYLYGIANLSSLVMSQLDDKPWHKNMQHPFEVLVQESSQAISHVFKGNFDKAFLKSLDVAMKASGLPISVKTYTKAVYNEVAEE